MRGYVRRAGTVDESRPENSTCERSAALSLGHAGSTSSDAGEIQIRAHQPPGPRPRRRRPAAAIRTAVTRDALDSATVKREGRIHGRLNRSKLRLPTHDELRLERSASWHGFLNPMAGQQAGDGRVWEADLLAASTHSH